MLWKVLTAIFDSGISHIYGAMLISISPFMGMIFQSYTGTASDQCQCFWEGEDHLY